MNEQRLWQAVALQATEDASGVWRDAEGKYISLNNYGVQDDALNYLCDSDFDILLGMADLDKTGREIYYKVRKNESL